MRMRRGALAAQCAADPLASFRFVGPGSAEQRERAAPRPGRECAWLMRDDAGISNPIVAAAASLKFEAY